MTSRSTVTNGSAILIRRSEVIDKPAPRRHAALDSRRLPEGVFLLAEADGKIIAAAPLESDEPAVGDRSAEPEDVRRLLELQARSLRTVAIAA
jgi:hypothetical protein